MAIGNPKTIEFLRIGNPWLVGKNVSRVVPVYSIHNLLEADLQRDKNLQAIKHLAFDAPKALAEGLAQRVDASEQDYGDLEETAFGLLSPERRLFRDKKNGGSSKLGSPFPVVGGLVAPTGSDDGLGHRVRELMEKHATDWQQRLSSLAVPSAPTDPATAFAFALLGGSGGVVSRAPVATPRRKLAGLDKACAEFIDNLICDHGDARRIPAIRRLASGVYLAAILRMVIGPVSETRKELPLVLAYCGMPPGSVNDPLVRAASKSYSDWIAESWKSTANLLFAAIDSSTVLPKTKRADKLRQQVHGLLAGRLTGRPKDVESTMRALEPLLDGSTLTAKWCKDAMESDIVGLSRAELARRVRSLGANIGFAGPDRGQRPRLMIDTPLLGVLVRGLVGKEPMELGDFVSLVAQRFGLVLGLGNDDSVADRMTALGTEGFDIYELLMRNQEHLRERLIRTGLARSYSDSHTEVFPND